MASNTLSLKIISQSYLSKHIKMDMKGFLINYNKRKYIGTIHHFVPIDKVINNLNNEVNIILNSCWSEILLLDPNDFDTSNIKIIKDIQNRLPNIENKLIMESETNRISLTVCGFDMIPYDNINCKYTLPYIKAKIDDVGKYIGLSGSPVFLNNKLVGIFSKYYPNENIALIIPTYVLIQNIKKKNNDHIYEFPFCPKKINKYIVRDYQIYHSTLRYTISLNTYILLEGDEDNLLKLLDNENKIEYTEMQINNDLDKIIEKDIIKKDKLTKITSRMLNLLKKIFQPDILAYIFMLINEAITKDSIDPNDLWLEYSENRFKII